MLNVKYLRIFCDVIYLLAQICIVSVDMAYKEVYTKKYWKFDIDLWPMKVNFFQWINNDTISVLYEFQIDISTNSWEIKYQNIGIGLLHVKRRTRQKWR